MAHEKQLRKSRKMLKRLNQHVDKTLKELSFVNSEEGKLLMSQIATAKEENDKLAVQIKRRLSEEHDELIKLAELFDPEGLLKSDSMGALSHSTATTGVATDHEDWPELNLGESSERNSPTVRSRLRDSFIAAFGIQGLMRA